MWFVCTMCTDCLVLVNEFEYTWINSHVCNHDHLLPYLILLQHSVTAVIKDRLVVCDAKKKMKSWQSPGIEPRTSGLSWQCWPLSYSLCSTWKSPPDMWIVRIHHILHLHSQSWMCLDQWNIYSKAVPHNGMCTCSSNKLTAVGLPSPKMQCFLLPHPR